MARKLTLFKAFGATWKHWKGQPCFEFAKNQREIKGYLFFVGKTGLYWLFLAYTYTEWQSKAIKWDQIYKIC